MQPENDNRRARADGIIAGLSPNELQRYKEAENNLRVHWAAMFGDRLNPLVVDNLAAESVLNIAVLEAIHGQPPLTDQSWRELAHEISENDHWVQLNLAHSDAAAKAKIRERVLANLPGARRMAMQRSGDLEAHVESAVREELDNRCAQRAA